MRWNTGYCRALALDYNPKFSSIFDVTIGSQTTKTSNCRRLVTLTDNNQVTFNRIPGWKIPNISHQHTQTQ